MLLGMTTDLNSETRPDSRLLDGNKNALPADADEVTGKESGLMRFLGCNHKDWHMSTDGNLTGSQIQANLSNRLPKD